jgi:hypothetical protein
MSTNSLHDLAEVLDRVRSWPRDQQLLLARSILEAMEESKSLNRRRGEKLDEILDAFRPADPLAYDLDYDRILEEELRKKYD